MAHPRRPRRRRYKAGEVPAYARQAPHRHTGRMGRRDDLERGFCRVCAATVAPGRNGRVRSWHDGRRLDDGSHEPNCLHGYKITTRPAYGKRVIATRDGRACKKCGAVRGRSYAWLHLDHVVPLADGGTPTEDNLQLLCADCHKAKTAAEATARAARRKAAKEAA